MSATSFVPALVPSVTHGSEPWTSSSAMKATRPPTFVNPYGSEDDEPAWMSFNILVPALLEIHSSVP